MALSNSAPKVASSQGVNIAYVHMLWASLAFAAMAAFSHLAGESCDWRFVVVARAAIAFVFAWLIAWLSGVTLVWRGPKTLWLRSVAGSIGMLCNFYALARLPVSDTLTLMNTAPIWVTLWLWLVFGQRPKLGVMLAVFTSVLGIALIQQPHFAGGKLACLMALGGAFCTSIVMLGLNRLQHVDPRAIVVHFSAVATLATLLFLLFTQAPEHWETLRNGNVIVLLLLVGATGVAGQIGMTRAFALGQATHISVIALTQILFGLLFDVMLWRRHVNGLSLIGMVLVILPAAWLILSELPQRSRALIKAEMED